MNLDSDIELSAVHQFLIEKDIQGEKINVQGLKFSKFRGAFSQTFQLFFSKNQPFTYFRANDNDF